MAKDIGRILCAYVDFLGMCAKYDAPLGLVHEYLDEALAAEDEESLHGFDANQRFGDFLMYVEAVMENAEQPMPFDLDAFLKRIAKG